MQDDRVGPVPVCDTLDLNTRAGLTEITKYGGTRHVGLADIVAISGVKSGVVAPVRQYVVGAQHRVIAESGRGDQAVQPFPGQFGLLPDIEGIAFASP